MQNIHKHEEVRLLCEHTKNKLFKSTQHTEKNSKMGTKIVSI